MRPIVQYGIGCWLGCLPMLIGLSAFAAELTPQEERGKTIYLEGTSPAGNEITAVIGDAGAEVPAAVMPCGSCHGPDGRGRPEGGISPSDLTWPALTKPYGIEHPSGRQHPPYDLRMLKRAITMGTDPAGNSLHVAMPRYRLTHQDAEDLVAYVQRLGTDLDPGLSLDSITLATQLPREGRFAALGTAIEAVLQAYFDDVNEQGGIYSRRINLRVIAAPDAADDRADMLRGQLETEEIFALVGSFLPGAEEQVADLVEELRTPLVGPFTQDPQLGWPLNPYVFYLLPGLEDLGRAMVSYAAERSDNRTAEGGSNRTAADIVDAEPRFEATAQAIVARANELDWPMGSSGELERIELAELGTTPDRVFLLASGEQQAAFFQRAAAAGWYPQVFLPGSLFGNQTFDAPAGFDDRIFLAFPTLPSNQAAASAREYRDLATRFSLPAKHVTAQIATLASAHVLIEALKRAGRELSRSRLIEVLEGFSEFDNGLTPLVTYGPNRRVGVQGAYLIALNVSDHSLVPASGWVKSR